MDTILLCSNHIPVVTSIHNTFIKKYMPEANGSYVKVYLYLSMCIQAGNEDLTISSLADKMENTEKDILRALKYWEKQKLLRITRSEDKSIILGIEFLNPDDSQEAQVVQTAQPSQMTQATQTTQADSTASSTLAASSSVKAVPNAPEVIGIVDVQPKKNAAPQHSFTVSASQSKKLSEDMEFTFTANAIQAFLDRPLKSNEVQLISYLYDNLHFSSDLLLHLYEYCISLGKTSVKYIQTVALSWDEKGVKTPAEAIDASSDFKASYNAISKAFALGRALAVIEKQYVERWQGEWNMDLSVVLEACNRTMLKIQKADFKYCEGILDNWHKANIRTLQDVEKADEAFAQKKAARRSSIQDANQSQASARTNRKTGYSAYVQRGLSADDASDLEKKLLKVK